MLQITPEALLVSPAESARREIRRRVRLSETLLQDQLQRKKKAKARKIPYDRRKRLVGTLARILRAGSPTLFEFEAACRHGLRRSLISEGWGWGESDDAAASVIHSALNQIGAERPSIDEAQRESATLVRMERYYCARCGTPIPDERKATGQAKYCSSLCNSAASQAKGRAFRDRVSRAEWLAQCARKSEQTVADLMKDCEQCGNPFLAERHRNRFCSYVCANAAAKKIDQHACAHCQTMFQPRMVTSGKLKTKQLQKFCSRACSDAGRRRDWGGRRPSTMKCEEA